MLAEFHVYCFLYLLFPVWQAVDEQIYDTICWILWLPVTATTVRKVSSARSRKESWDTTCQMKSEMSRLKTVN